MQMLKFDRQGITCLDSNRCLLWRGQIVIEDSLGTYNTEFSTTLKSGQGTAGDWQLRVDQEPDGMSLTNLLIQVLPPPDRILKRVFLSIITDETGSPFARTGNTMLALPGSPNMQDGVTLLDETQKLSSSLMTLIVRADGSRAWLFGIGEPTPSDFSFFDATGGTLRAGCAPSRQLARETTFRLVFATGPDPYALLDAYGDFLKPFARKTPPPTTGWNSWDYYQGAISMCDLRKEMSALNASPLQGKCRTIVIDMGWESRLGDWKPNRKFPSSYREIAAEIEASGFVPGIWTTPLLASIYSPIARHQQHLLARRANGNPVVLSENAVLDLSHSDVRDTLYRLYDELHQAGFRFFKVDYVYQDTIDQIESWQDHTLGKAAMIRKGFETIRAAVGEDSHILNCYGPTEATLGLCDSSRVSMDIHNFWGHIKFNAGQIAARLWQNGKLWRIDPEFALARTTKTTSDCFLNPPYEAKALLDGQFHWMAGQEASLLELQTWLSVVYLAAGNLFLADSIARLNALGLETLGRIFPPLLESARPLDLFSSKPPRFWLAKSASGPVLGVFNWGNEPQPIIIPRGMDLPSQGVDVWTGKTIAVSEATILPAHGSVLLK